MAENQRAYSAARRLLPARRPPYTRTTRASASRVSSVRIARSKPTTGGARSSSGKTAVSGSAGTSRSPGDRDASRTATRSWTTGMHQSSIGGLASR